MQYNVRCTYVDEAALAGSQLPGGGGGGQRRYQDQRTGHQGSLQVTLYAFIVFHLYLRNLRVLPWFTGHQFYIRFCITGHYHVLRMQARDTAHRTRFSLQDEGTAGPASSVKSAGAAIRLNGKCCCWSSSTDKKVNFFIKS